MTLANLATILTSPLVHGPILFFIFKGLVYIKPKATWLNYLAILPLFWLFFCSITYSSVLLIKPLEDQYPVIHLQSEEWRKTDAIVVLACNHFEDPGLPFVSRWPNCSLQRNLHAALMYKQHPMPIYLAGSILSSKDKYSQAYHNKSFFENLGVASSDIIIIPEGTNTETEVHALSTLLNTKHVSVVTSASHLPRALHYFKENKIQALPIPVEHLSRKDIKPTIDLPNAASIYRSERAIHEYLGLIYQKYVR